MSKLNIIRKLKFQIVKNILNHLEKYVYVHIIAATIFFIVVVKGGYEFLYILFSFLEQQEPFGPLLINRLISMVIMVFFSMLIFSNLIITLSTTYISKEIDFYMSMPLNYKDIFKSKLTESIVYSSWAFILFSLPLFLSFGIIRKVNLSYYFLTFLTIIPFIAIPACIGAIITMLLAAFFPARKTRTMTFILAGLSIIAIVIIIRLINIRGLLFNADQITFKQMMDYLNITTVPILPNNWFTLGLISLAKGNYKEFIFWFLMLLSTALMLLQVSIWLVPKLYYRGWVLSKESDLLYFQTYKKGIFYCIDKVLNFLFPIKTSTLIKKDARVFWRDPTQWSQLVILFGLLAIYIANIRSSRYNLFIPKWQVIISFFNLGTISFVLAILTTRFVYPMLSLEGRQFWILGLAPMKKEKIVWEKFWLCWLTSFFICEILMIFSNLMLKVNLLMFILSTITILFLSFGLTGISVGLGALTPNFKEDNPARIANGLGGTLNLILSFFYILSIISAEFFLTQVKPEFFTSHTTLITIYKFGLITIILFLSLLATFLPMHLGLRNWRRLEF